MKIQEWILGIAVLLMAGLMIANVFCRFALGFSLTYAGEVTQFCIMAVSFIGMAYAANKGRHIRMTAIYDQLPQSTKKLTLLIIQVLTLVLMLTLLFYSIDYLSTVYQLGAIYPATRIPFFLIYALVPLGFALTAIEYIAAIYQNIRFRDKLFTSSQITEKSSAQEPTSEATQQ